MKEISYNRSKVLAYARKWAFGRNPAYADFSEMGGDCANFGSQCIFAGCAAMNYDYESGWYFLSLANRAPAWSSAALLGRFLTQNDSYGPYGADSTSEKLEVGDIILLAFSGEEWRHTLVVTGRDSRDIFVAAHTFDAFMRRLSSYSYENARCIHIIGARQA